MKLSDPIGRIAAGAVLLALCWPGAAASQQIGHNRPFFLFVGNGRIVLVPGTPHNQSHTSSGHADGRSVRMEYVHQGNETSVDWTATGNGEQEAISIRADADTTVQMSRKPSEGAKTPRVTFTQTPGKPLELRVGEGDGAQVWRAENLWLLLLQCPEECQNLLFPSLTGNGVGLMVPFRYDALRDALLQSSVEPSGTEKWDRLVAQLDDDSFALREAADRTLRAEGDAALVYLRELDLSKLRPEQQCRIARMLRADESPLEVDKPPQVAKRLRSDPRTWLFLLSDADETVRRGAVEKLKVLLGREVDFDPAADEPTRERQLGPLRAELLEKAPAVSTPAEVEQ